jgi:GntR family transcriptional regulator
MRRLGIDTDMFASLPDVGQPGDAPSHARIEQWLVDASADGRLVAGDRLPPEGDLAAAFGVSRMTLRQALAALARRGYVLRKRGRSGGTFVARPRIECDLTGLPGFTEQMRRAQLRAGARVVGAQVINPPQEVIRALHLGRGHDKAYRVVRVRSADREPLALETTFLPASLFPGLLDRRLTGSLYSLMSEDYDLAPHTAHEWLEPVVADVDEARLLGTEVGAALMLVTRTAYTSTGVPVEHAYDRYRADRTRITLQTRVGA